MKAETIARAREAVDALLSEWETDVSAAPTTVQARPVVRAASTPPSPTASLPKAVTPAKGVMTDEARKKHLPAAKAVALKILRVIGETSTLAAGVTGQLALERIPFDATLVQQAIEAARRELQTA